MPTPPISQDEIKHTINTIEQCLREGFRPPHTHMRGCPSAIEEAARRLNIPSGTLRSRIGSPLFPVINWSLFDPALIPIVSKGSVKEQVTDTLPSEEIKTRDHRLEVRSLRDKISRLESQLAEADRGAISAEEVRTQIFKLAEYSPDPPAWMIPKHASSSVTGVPQTIWSDWHLGEVVTPAEVNGVNEYNLAIAEARIRKLVDSTLNLCLNHMTNPQYPGIVVGLLGDIISGALHPELAETDEIDIFPSILWAVDRLIWALDRLLERFSYVYCHCSPGNHGRVLDRKPRASGYTERNADWLIYNMLERHYRDIGQKRIQFDVPLTGESLFRIYNHRYMAVHGDDLGVKGGDGIIGSLGPIARGEIKMRHSSAQIGRDYSTLLLGHWHQEFWLPRAHINNTLKGIDPYARRVLRAPATPPSQSLWFNHPKYGITARWSVRVEDSQVSKEVKWLSWPEKMAS